MVSIFTQLFAPFPQNIAVSTGTSDADFDKTKQILVLNSSIKYICIDVANGYSQFFVDFVKRARSQWPDKTIMAGNVVTAEMVEELILVGADTADSLIVFMFMSVAASICEITFRVEVHDSN